MMLMAPPGIRGHHLTEALSKRHPKGASVASLRLFTITGIRTDAQMPTAQRYAYRSFDGQYLIVDGRLVSRMHPPLWNSRSASQVYLAGLLTEPLGSGPALTATALVPDLDHFSGCRGKDAIPLYRTADTTEPNLAPGLLDLLSTRFARDLNPLAFAAYVYGILAHPAFSQQFSAHLYEREICVPITNGRSSQN